jgi:hypothetical protein
MTTDLTFARYLQAAVDDGCMSLTPNQIHLCARDLHAMDEDEDHPDADAVLTVWLTRIGGWRHVPDYAACLEAGARRGQHEDQVYVVVVKLKSQDRIRRIDSVHRAFGKATARLNSIYLDPRERAEIIAKAIAD